MKICVYAIAKDEQKHVRRFMQSVKDADLVVVGVDPGDNTGDLLKQHGAIVHEIVVEPFRFDSYRNAVLEKIPNDVDVCISLDLDEVLQDGWREEIERCWSKDTTRLHYQLKWDANDEHTFHYDRIHARHGYIWKHANHEAVYHRFNEEVISHSNLIVVQHQDTGKDRSKNLSLLEQAVSEDKTDSRSVWYLGREYYNLQKYDEAIDTFHHYLNLHSHWDAERSWACIFLSRCYRNLDDYWTGIAWLHTAIRECPTLRDPYYELALSYMPVSNLEKKIKVVSDHLSCRKALKEIDKALEQPHGVHNFMHHNGAYTYAIYETKAHYHKILGEHNLSDQALEKANRLK